MILCHFRLMNLTYFQSKKEVQQLENILLIERTESKKVRADVVPVEDDIKFTYKSNYIASSYINKLNFLS